MTVVFCDLAGSTALGEAVDPERLRVLLAGYFERMRGIVERHGGSVEKFIGDAVMCVFGVPVVHEDDALRAVRAAHEMREALPELGLEGRLGVMTGEVVTGTDERLATGDAVNVAARLEQAAGSGEVLIGEPTLALVVDSVEVEAVEPLVLKGKSEPVRAYRLLRVLDALRRRHDTRFVGRDRELGLLGDAWQGTLSGQRCELVTVVGEAGVGKSRLVEEALAEMSAATVVRGRCLPYGEGITYWPIVEALKQLDTRPSDASVAAAIAVVLGESDAATSADEIAWAFRKTLEQAAAEGPLVVVFDDIQWGEETFLDLIEHVALLSSSAPILLVCMARPELVEQRPSWPVTLRLAPLDDDTVDRMIPHELPAELRKRIAHAAGGNPLYVTEILAVADEAKGDIVVPATLQALLAARLDQLDELERAVLEAGSIEGEVFHRGAVQALAPDGATVMPVLTGLVRKQLIRPECAQLAGDDGFRFHHLLLRDTAYDALSKATRAVLHERFADWLAEHDGVVELDELLGHHLERAHAYRTELGMPHDDRLAAAARQHLKASGFRATNRQDYGAASSLLERAAALVPPAEIDLDLEVILGEALLWAGRTEEAVSRSDALVARARAAGDDVAELCGQMRAAWLRWQRYPVEITDRIAALLDHALPVFEAADDQLALYVGYFSLSELLDWQGRHDAALHSLERAETHARLAGHQSPAILGGLAFHRFAGTTPLSELLAWLDEVGPSAGQDQFLRAFRADALAKLGEIDKARAMITEMRALQAERGGGLFLANLNAFESVWVEMLADNPAAAADFASEGLRLHEQMGNDLFTPAAACQLANALYALDRLDEAENVLQRTAAIGTYEGLRAARLGVTAKLLARRGEHVEAERLAREAVTVMDGTDALDRQGDTHADLAEVLFLAGKRDDAAAALDQALDCYRRKGNLVMARRVSDRLVELEDRSCR